MDRIVESCDKSVSVHRVVSLGMKVPARFALTLKSGYLRTRRIRSSASQQGFIPISSTPSHIARLRQSCEKRATKLGESWVLAVWHCAGNEDFAARKVPERPNRAAKFLHASCGGATHSDEGTWHRPIAFTWSRAVDAQTASMACMILECAASDREHDEKWCTLTSGSVSLPSDPHPAPRRSGSVRNRGSCHAEREASG
jgi:hypothetical protein